MKQYIDKALIAAEIEKYISNYKEILNKADKSSYNWLDSAMSLESKIDVLQHILSFLNTLEMEEVDLKQEINKYIQDNIIGYCVPGTEETAKHFFELGLRASADEDLVEEIYAHIDSIKDTADRMTSGNFMHHRASIKFSANTIAKVLELIGLKAQKGK